MKWEKSCFIEEFTRLPYFVLYLTGFEEWKKPYQILYDDLLSFFVLDFRIFNERHRYKNSQYNTTTVLRCSITDKGVGQEGRVTGLTLSLGLPSSSLAETFQHRGFGHVTDVHCDSVSIFAIIKSAAPRMDFEIWFIVVAGVVWCPSPLSSHHLSHKGNRLRSLESVIPIRPRGEFISWPDGITVGPRGSTDVDFLQGHFSLDVPGLLIDDKSSMSTGELSFLLFIKSQCENI